MNRSFVIPNGINIDAYVPSPTLCRKTRIELDIPASAFVVGHVARLHPIKNHTLFLKSAARLVECFPNIYFVLCGRAVLPDNEVFRRIVLPEQRNRFRFLGERRDVPSLMAAMDCCVQTSNSEAFPNALAEAMACGVPCIATDVGESAAIISSFGHLVAPRDEDALVESISRLLMLPQPQRRLMGERAREHVKQSFALDAIVGQYVALYENLV